MKFCEITRSWKQNLAIDTKGRAREREGGGVEEGDREIERKRRERERGERQIWRKRELEKEGDRGMEREKERERGRERVRERVGGRERDGWDRKGVGRIALVKFSEITRCCKQNLD